MTTHDPLKLARDALQKLACLGNGDKPGNSTGNVIALTTLAAIDAMPARAPVVAWHMRVIGCDGSADWLEMGAAHPETPQGVEALPLVYAPASVPSREPDDLLGEAAHAITALLSLIRRNAPELSGKTLRFAEAVAAKIATAPAVAAPEPLRAAAQAVLDRWNSPRWEWSKQGPTADLMLALAGAIAQEPQQ